MKNQTLKMYYHGTWTVIRDESSTISPYHIYHEYYDMGKKHKIVKFHGNTIKSCLDFLSDTVGQTERSVPCITPQ